MLLEAEAAAAAVGVEATDGVAGPRAVEGVVQRLVQHLALTKGLANVLFV